MRNLIGKRENLNLRTGLLLGATFLGGSLCAIAVAGFMVFSGLPVEESARLWFQIKSQLEDLPSRDDKIETVEAFSRFSEVLSGVERLHYQSKLDKKTVSVMIEGALKPLDPYSGYITEKTKEDLSSKEGAYEGLRLGFAVDKNSEGYRIEAIEDGSPAEHAGLFAGDVIVLIDGQDVSGQSVDEVSALLKKEIEDKKGDELSIGIERSGMMNPIEKHIRPERIDPMVVYNLGVQNDVLHLHIRAFYPGIAETTSLLIERAVKLFGIKGVVLDLRNNGGGLTSEAVKLSELFLMPSSLLYEMSGRTIGVEEVRTWAIPEFPDIGLSIIVNGQSASAAELVAGAMQAHNRAKIVGWRTYGKGMIQKVYGVDDALLRHDGALMMTFAKYRDGGLRDIEGIGVIPDELMEAPDPLVRPSRFEADSARSIAIVAAKEAFELKTGVQ